MLEIALSSLKLLHVNSFFFFNQLNEQHLLPHNSSDGEEENGQFENMDMDMKEEG